MGRTFIFYAIAAAGLLIVAMNADSIEGRQSQASMIETLLVVGGVLVLLVAMRFALARFSARRDRKE